MEGTDVDLHVFYGKLQEDSLDVKSRKEGWQEGVAKPSPPHETDDLAKASVL
jgi:hypothetical protein